MQALFVGDTSQSRIGTTIVDDLKFFSLYHLTSATIPASLSCLPEEHAPPSRNMQHPPRRNDNPGETSDAQ